MARAEREKKGEALPPPSPAPPAVRVGEGDAAEREGDRVVDSGGDGDAEAVEEVEALTGAALAGADWVRLGAALGGAVGVYVGVSPSAAAVRVKSALREGRGDAEADTEPVGSPSSRHTGGSRTFLRP